MNTTQEIREGNWVINSKGDIIKAKAEFAKSVMSNGESCTPIEITEGILESNGFKKYDMDPDWIIFLKHAVVCPDSPFYSPKGNNTLPFTIFKLKNAQTDAETSFHVGFEKEPAYLHQLQNLHQDVLNQELIVMKRDLE